jgi:peroxiredoxin
MEDAIRAGDPVPDFALKDQHNEEFRLSSALGKRVLLSFHPLAFTQVCTRQMQAIEAAMDRLAGMDVIPVGISIDAVPSKHAWGKEIGLKHLRILSDFWPHGGVASSIGLFREKDGFSQRANVVVDADGSASFVRVYDIPQLPDLEEILAFLEKNRA